PAPPAPPTPPAGAAPPAPPAGATPRAAQAPPAGRTPALIRMSIYNKEEGRYDLRINLPVAFAQMLMDALGEDAKQAIRHEAARRGINLEDVFDAIQKAGPGRFLEVDTEDTRIEVWIE